jgi:hypothetical protein
VFQWLSLLLLLRLLLLCMWLLCCAVYPFCWWLALLLFAGYRLLLARWPFLFDCCWLWLVLGLAAVLALRQRGVTALCMA